MQPRHLSLPATDAAAGRGSPATAAATVAARTLHSSNPSIDQTQTPIAIAERRGLTHAAPGSFVSHQPDRTT